MGTLAGIGLVLLIIVLAVISASDEPSKKKVKGKVLEKHFVPSHDETVILTSMIFVDGVAVPLHTPSKEHRDDAWYLVVEVKEGKTEKCLVSRDVYDKVQVGEFIDLK